MRTKWKEFQFNTSNGLHELDSCRSSIPELKKYKISIETGPSILETNASWAVLRSWFRFAGVRMPRDYHIGDKPSWEYKV
jgi:hypothetical protein